MKEVQRMDKSKTFRIKSSSCVCCPFTLRSVRVLRSFSVTNHLLLAHSSFGKVERLRDCIEIPFRRISIRDLKQTTRRQHVPMVLLNFFSKCLIILVLTLTSLIHKKMLHHILLTFRINTKPFS